MIIKKYKIYLINIYVFILGIITSFSLPPFNYWIINFFTFTLLFVLLFKNKNQNKNFFFINGYIFGFGYFVSSLYWIPLSLLYDDNFKYLVPFALILIPTFLSFFYGAAFLSFSFFLKFKSVFINILIFSVVLGFFEFIRGKILSGFPWNLFAYSFSETINFIQINSLIGVYAFNTKIITLFCIPSILFLNKSKNDLIGFFIIIFICTCSYLYGIYKINNFNNFILEKLPLEIKIISSNIPIERFYNNVDEQDIIKELINLSNPNQNHESIFIWPEGIIPNANFKILKNEYGYLFRNSFSKNHQIILGINDEESNSEKLKIYNSLIAIDNEANILYNYKKNKLVPFGEFLPLENILSKMGLKTLTNNYLSYTASSERKLFNLYKNSSIKILPLICYEIIYSGEISKDKDYNFIVNISEDGWFGDSIGPHQHFAHSIFRSIEYGKYTLRSANNGISAIVDPTGFIVDKLEVNNKGVISINEIVYTNKTLFSTYGNKIYFLIILLYIFLIFSFKKMENE